MSDDHTAKFLVCLQVIKRAVRNVYEMSLEDFIFHHPAQIALLGIQFQWTADTQAALVAAKSDKTIMAKNMKKTDAILRCVAACDGLIVMMEPSAHHRMGLCAQYRCWSQCSSTYPLQQPTVERLVGPSTLLKMEPGQQAASATEQPTPLPSHAPDMCLCDWLHREMVMITLRTDLNRIQRTNLETCITVHMHQKESTEDLMRKKVHWTCFPPVLLLP